MIHRTVVYTVDKQSSI